MRDAVEPLSSLIAQLKALGREKLFRPHLQAATECLVGIVQSREDNRTVVKLGGSQQVSCICPKPGKEFRASSYSKTTTLRSGVA